MTKIDAQIKAEEQRYLNRMKAFKEEEKKHLEKMESLAFEKEKSKKKEYIVRITGGRTRDYWGLYVSAQVDGVIKNAHIKSSGNKEELLELRDTIDTWLKKPNTENVLSEIYANMQDKTTSD